MSHPHTAAAQLADINMVPFIDILLVLLIIFMVLTPLTPMGLPAVVPGESAATPPETRKSLVITVKQGGQLYLNREQMLLTDLPERLREIFRNTARPVLFVQGESDLEFREVAQVIDHARGAGVQHIGLMTQRAR